MSHFKILDSFGHSFYLEADDYKYDETANGFFFSLDNKIVDFLDRGYINRIHEVANDEEVDTSVTWSYPEFSSV